MASYARRLPIDQNNNPYPAPPPFTSNQSQTGVPVASSVITLNDKTTVIDVTVMATAAASAGIIGKWGSASVTSSNYDWVVQAGNFRTFVVPVSVMGTSSVAGANVANGLYNSVSVKTVNGTAASILTAEY